MLWVGYDLNHSRLPKSSNVTMVQPARLELGLLALCEHLVVEGLHLTLR
jgi:hypothetical protein